MLSHSTSVSCILMSSWHLHPALLSSLIQDECKIHSKTYRKWTFMTTHETKIVQGHSFWNMISKLQPPENSRKCWKSVLLEFPCSQCRKQDFIDDISLCSRLSVTSCNDICASFLLYWDPTSTNSQWGPVTQFPTNIPSTTISRYGSAD
jgi:hypothetical protein